MTQTHTSFDLLLHHARDLDVTVVTGRLWPPKAGCMWLGDQSLEEILLPHTTGDAVALAIIPGGPGWEHVRIGGGTLSADQLARLTQIASEAGGNLYRGRLEQLTPEQWLERHGRGQQAGSAQSRIDAAKDAGWPAAFGDYPVLFLDKQPIYHLIARENIGRNVTLLIGTLLKSALELGGQR